MLSAVQGRILQTWHYGGNTFAYALTQSSSVAYPSAEDLITRTAVDAHHWTWLLLNPQAILVTSLRSTLTPLCCRRGRRPAGDLRGHPARAQNDRRCAALCRDYHGELPEPDIQTEAEIKQWIMQEAWGYHTSCSVPIGADDDKRLEVQGEGLEGLRVVDASVFPKIPSFYIVSSVYMISEKAADVIIQDTPGY